ncbi:putative adenylate/guanylate cyclase [Mycobacteroides abscessus subsp. abscessus]|nr:putative adenylate/guanylate cyclase [Mycobacteroides abscessus subsp. abscessus]
MVEVWHDDEQETENTMSQSSEKATDPVCGMSIDPASAAETATHEGLTYHFCSTHCAQTFRADPAQYATAVAP